MPWVTSARLGKERDSIQLKSPKSGQMSMDHSEGADKEENSNSKPKPPPPGPFQFAYRTYPIDWRVLHGVDIDRLVSYKAPQILPSTLQLMHERKKD